MMPDKKTIYQKLEKQINELVLEEKLKQSEEMLEDFFNLSPLLMVITNPEGKVYKVNKSCMAILGYTEKEILKIGLWPLVHPDDIEITNKAIEEQLKGSQILNFTNRYKNKNGNYRTLEWQATIVKNGFTYASAYDITKQNDAIAELLFQREEKEKRTDELSVANIELDYQTDEKAKRANELSIANKELAFQNDEKEKRANELSIANKELAFQNDEKEKRAEELSIANKELAYQNDEKEKRAVELNEAQSIAHFGSWLFSPKTQKSEWSDEMFYIWGFEPKNGTPKDAVVIKRIHTDDLELYTSSVANASGLGTPYDIEFRICIPNVEQKTLRAICQPVLGDFGKTISLKGTCQDITSQKLFEVSLVKHERLKAIGEMSSSIAHDFNNSLQGMMGNLEIAKSQNDLSDSTRQRLNSIGFIIDDVASRVGILQHFGDTEHNSKKAEFINLNTMIAESLEQSRPLWKDNTEKKGLKISTITDFGDIPKISCNKGELKTAIYNLIKNSVEAMPTGGNIIIETGIKAEGIFATFTDTGIGMDEESKLKIFQPFYSTKGFKVGKGLGMSGVYSVVKRNKGDVAIKFSELGKGTTIEIIFPILQQDKIKITSKKEPEPKGTESFRVLWVDDDDTIRENASELVELIGHNCDNVNSGQSALEYLNKNTYDIVFTDIGMPNMNGWELAAAIKDKFGDKIKIVVVTGWDIDEKTKNEHDIAFVLQKPFTLEDLEKLFIVV